MVFFQTLMNFSQESTYHFLWWGSENSLLGLVRRFVSSRCSQLFDPKESIVHELQY